MDSLTVANTRFALDLLQKLNESNNADNIFFSPLSISAALAMVYLGAKGNTADQMAKVLHFDNAGDVHAYFQALSANINKPNSFYELKMANRLYGEKSFDFLPEFFKLTKKFYQAELSPVDFLHHAEEARNEINTWVESQTAGKIKDLLTAGGVDSTTKLILANAVYFNGAWKEKFEKEMTQDMPFRKNKNDTEMVKMMIQEEDFKYNHIDELQIGILELPYLKDKMSMFILLPDDFSDNSTGLEKLQKELSFQKLSEWTDPKSMRRTLVLVFLPRFKLEESYDLGSLLVSMGMADAFGDSADFSGMTGRKELCISKVAHKSFVDVNEEGTEAAAATGIKMVPMCARYPKEFKADHPFLFFIRHNKTRNILFFGRFCHP